MHYKYDLYIEGELILHKVSLHEINDYLSTYKLAIENCRITRVKSVIE